MSRFLNLPRFLNLIVALILSISIVPAMALEAKLPPKEEARARILFTELRCVVCQNQSIDSSDADVAIDLRKIVREQIQAGKTNQQIKDFLVFRYGEYILLKPAIGWHTMLLWASPFIILLAGGVLLFGAVKNAKREISAKLTQAEEDELNAVLKNAEEV